MSGVTDVSFSSSDWSPSVLPATAMLPPVGAPVLGKGPKAAREFEAQLIGTVLASLEKTFATVPGQDAMAGEDDYNYLGTQALASAIAAGGGFGIAKLISEHLGKSRMEDTKVAPEARAGALLESTSGY
jgi:Rod binding domain-containing protein